VNPFVLRLRNKTKWRNDLLSTPEITRKEKPFARTKQQQQEEENKKRVFSRKKWL
jgi:hypothetical protein